MSVQVTARAVSAIVSKNDNSSLYQGQWNPWLPLTAVVMTRDVLLHE